MNSVLARIDVDPAELWLGRRILGDLVERLQGPELTKRLKLGLEDWAENTIEQSCQEGVRVDPEKICSKLVGIRVVIEYKPTGSSHYGELLPVAGGFQVAIDSQSGASRKRFALAHEIGHMLFFSWTAPIPVQPFRSSRYWVQEGYASEVARMLLVPRRLILERLSREPREPNLTTFFVLSRVFDVSTEVLRRRLITDLKTWDCMLFTSKILGNQVVTDSSSISKGKSFQTISVPRILGDENWSVFLRKCILNAPVGETSLERIEYRRMGLVAESRRDTGSTESTATTLIRREAN